MILRLLTVVNDLKQELTLRKRLSQFDVITQSLRDNEDLWQRVSEEVFDIFILSQSLLKEPVATAICRLRELTEEPLVVLLTETESSVRQTDIQMAGCDAVLWCGLPEEEIAGTIKGVIDIRRQFILRNLPGRELVRIPDFNDFVSLCPTMQNFMKQVHKVAASGSSLLILGETGVGKERLAKAIHAYCGRRSAPFIAINCGAMPETLLDDEIFGHAKGAFTGATCAHRGCFELAHKGTLLLDEIGELPYHLQVKLLRVLQEREVQPLGCEKTIPVDVRVIAATSSNLEQGVANGKFRADLYYRLNVVTLTVPSLRERLEDIPELAKRQLEYLNRSMHSRVNRISDEALKAMERYRWPGNVRELFNVLERAMLISEDSTICLDDLPMTIGGCLAACTSQALRESAGTFPAEWLTQTWAEIRNAEVCRLEKWYFENLLKEMHGKIGETAERAGLDMRSINEKMRKYGLNKMAFRTRKPVEAEMES